VAGLSFVTTHWLLCVYIGALPWPFTLRIWDAFLLEGLLRLCSSALSGAHSARTAGNAVTTVLPTLLRIPQGPAGIVVQCEGRMGMEWLVLCRTQARRQHCCCG
jgi:hypothetical protein